MKFRVKKDLHALPSSAKIFKNPLFIPLGTLISLGRIGLIPSIYLP